MSQQADQLILDYLAQIGMEAGTYLGPTGRRRYIEQVRERIESQLPTTRNVQQVHRVLQRLGDPQQLVAQDCAEPRENRTAEGSGGGSAQKGGHNGRRGIGVLSRPVLLRRAPPPWRGGPRRATFYRRDDAAGSASDSAETGNSLPAWEGRKWQVNPGLVFVRLVYAAKHYPLDVLALTVYLISGLISALTFLWPIAAVQLVLGRLWRTVDRWVAFGVPFAATVVGMALWDSSAWVEQRGWEPYPDEYLLHSLLDTGVLGLQIATVACFFYLAWRASRIVRSDNARV